MPERTGTTPTTGSPTPPPTRRTITNGWVRRAPQTGGAR